MQTITIELRVDFDTVDAKLKEPIMLDLAQQKARELLTDALLIAGKREPQIMVTSGDFFATTKEIGLFKGDAT